MPITLYEKTCLSVCRRRQCPIEWGDFLKIERGDPLRKEIQEAQIRTLLDKQKEQILAECQARINKLEFQAAYDRRSLQKLGEIVNSQQEELHLARAEEVQQRDQQLHQGQLLQQNLELREAHQRSLTEMEELRKFQSSTFDTIARRKLVEEQNTILELSGRTQELQNEINCMSDSKEFQDAESSRSGNSHVTSRPVSFPPHPIPAGMLSRSFGVPSRREGPPSIWDTHGISGNVFVNPDASSSATYPQELHQWSSSIEEPLHSSTVEKCERQKQVRDLRCQSGPSAKDSVILSGGDCSTSSLANLFVSHEVCLWNVSSQEDSVCCCFPLDDEEATALPSEEDEAMRKWRQEFPEQMRRAIIRIHTNLGHPHNSTLAKMISDAGGSEEMIKCSTRYPCSVCKRMSRPRLRRPVSIPRTRQFNDTLLADVHFWNCQGHEVLVYFQSFLVLILQETCTENKGSILLMFTCCDFSLSICPPLRTQ